MGIDELTRISALIRADVLKMTTAAGSGHPGGSMSSADIMTALFFGGLLRHDPKDPGWEGRDRFILSKGHVAPVLYSVLARAGYFPLNELGTLRQLGSRLQGHPDRLKLPGIEMSTGSLGQGLSIAAGLAYALKNDPSHQGYVPRVVALLGDGECQEGQVWEASMFSSFKGLDNLIAIVDNNGLQIDGRINEVCDPEDLASKFSSFNWKVVQVDGHDIEALLDVLTEAFAGLAKTPTMVIAHTIKSKGVSFMEDLAVWHGKSLGLDQLALALDELSVGYPGLLPEEDWQ